MKKFFFKLLILTNHGNYNEVNDDDGNDVKESVDDEHRVRLLLEDAPPQKLARAGSPKPHWDVKESATKCGIDFGKIEQNKCWNN